MARPVDARERVRLVLGPRQVEALQQAIADWYVMREGKEWYADETRTADALDSINEQIASARRARRRDTASPAS